MSQSIMRNLRSFFTGLFTFAMIYLLCRHIVYFAKKIFSFSESFLIPSSSQRMSTSLVVKSYLLVVFSRNDCIDIPILEARCVLVLPEAAIFSSRYCVSIILYLPFQQNLVDLLSTISLYICVEYLSTPFCIIL